MKKNLSIEDWATREKTGFGSHDIWWDGRHSILSHKYRKHLQKFMQKNLGKNWDDVYCIFNFKYLKSPDKHLVRVAEEFIDTEFHHRYGDYSIDPITHILRYKWTKQPKEIPKTNVYIWIDKYTAYVYFPYQNRPKQWYKVIHKDTSEYMHGDRSPSWYSNYIPPKKIHETIVDADSVKVLMSSYKPYCYMTKDQVTSLKYSRRKYVVDVSVVSPKLIRELEKKGVLPKEIIE
jgi:hypothetical protein